MDRWAVKYGDDATFVCVGCAGPELAETFGSRLRLKHCVNSYVSRNNMPRWGQLGCNGFIVLDGSHSVTCKATAPFLEVGETAFQHVEALLNAMLDAPPVPDGSGPPVGDAEEREALCSSSDS